MSRLKVAAPATVSPLVTALRGLGLTDYETRAYAALAPKQPATAHEIAEQAGLPRANVYSSLRTLEGKGVIQPVTESPVRYVPANPGQFFRGIRRSTAGLCGDIVREMRCAVRDDGNDYVSVLCGEPEVRLRLREMIEGARHHVWIKGTVTLIAPHARELPAAERLDVTLRLILLGEALPKLKPHRHIQVILHEGDGRLHGPPSYTLLTVTVDGSSMLIASFMNTARASFARDYPMIHAIETLLLHEIYLAEIHPAFWPQLEAHFGRQLAGLPRKYRLCSRGRPVIEGREPVTP